MNRSIYQVVSWSYMKLFKTLSNLFSSFTYIKFGLSFSAILSFIAKESIWIIKKKRKRKKRTEERWSFSIWHFWSVDLFARYKYVCTGCSKCEAILTVSCVYRSDLAIQIYRETRRIYFQFGHGQRERERERWERTVRIRWRSAPINEPLPWHTFRVCTTVSF